MKKIFRNLKFGLMLCAGALVASCSDVDDAMNEIPYARVLTPLNFEASVDASVGTDIKFSWSAVSNADSYILELFEAVPTITESGEEVFELPESFNDLTTYDMIEVAKDAVPYTVQNLEVDKSFWARVRGVSEKLDGSYWACLTEPVTTSAVRKGLNPTITERTASSITLKWDDAEDKGDLTSIRCELVVPVEGATATNKTLDDNEIKSCQAKFENLDPCTNYKFTLLFGKSGSRGIITAYTRPNIGEVTTVNSAEALYNALNGATGEVKLQLAYNDGIPYDLKPYLTADAGTEKEAVISLPLLQTLHLYGESTPDGKKPVMMNFQFELTGDNCHAIHIEDVNLDGGNNFGYIVSVEENGKATLPESFELVNCEIANFTKGIFSISDKATIKGKCERFLIENVYTHDVNPVGANGGDFIDIRTKTAELNYGSIEIKNSTFYASARTFLRCRDGVGIGSISIVNCTFNQVTATNNSSNNSGILELQNFKPTAVNLTKCVFLNENNPNEVASQSGQQWVKLTSNKTTSIAPTCVGNIFYNVGTTDKDGKNFFFNQPSVDLAGNTFSQELALKEGGMILEDDPCINSIAGKMYLKNNSSIAANRVGDPRWWNATMPEVVRATELEVVTEDKTWDFTEKTIFDTETIEANTIIDNIRIYAPAEVVMTEGVTFAAAATVNNNGIPTSNALAFKAEGPGAVEVTTVDGGINSSVVVLAGGDRYVLLADGVTHKVVLGDLQGANEIYVLAGCPITVLNVTWTKNLDPEATTSPLAAPKVAFDVTSAIEIGTEKAVTASWDAVANAASYEITFNNVKQPESSETTFVIDAATVAGLSVGEYKISVVAKPVPTSTKYTPSEAGEASFKIKAPVVGVEKTVTWNFLTFDGTNLNDAATGDPATWTSNTAFTNNVVWNVNADCPLTILKEVAVVEKSQAKMQDGKAFADGSTPDKRALSFVAPEGGGTLTIVHKSANATATDRNTWVSVDGQVTDAGCAPKGEDGWKSVDVDLSDIEAGKTVYIFTKGNVIQSVSYKYTAQPQTYTYDWDFTTYNVDENCGSALGADITWANNERELKIMNGVTLEKEKQAKLGEAKTGISGDVYTPSHRALSFVAQGPGKLTYVHKSGSSSDATRRTWVSINGVRDTRGSSGEPGYLALTDNWDTQTIELEAEAGQTIYIFSKGNSIQSVKWEETR